MSTLAEIESAIERLPVAEREALEGRLLSRRFGLDALDAAERAALLAYPNLPDPAAHRRNRLPVALVESVLHPIELIATRTTSTDGELPEVVEGVANELDRLHRQ